MFSGIIRAMGTVRYIDVGGAATDGAAGRRYIIVTAPRAIIRVLRRGASVAVQGVCLTVTQLSWWARTFAADIISTTYERTTISRWRPGERVNVELALGARDRWDGHVVQGHVTGTARVQDIHHDSHGSTRIITFCASTADRSAIVPQGSVAVNGISLTVADCAGSDFTVGITPHTWGQTTLQYLRPGALVNIETDVMLRAAVQSGVSQ